MHPKSTKKEKVTLYREAIHIETVLGDHRKPDDTWEYLVDPQKRIVYVRLTAFSRDTAGHLRNVLADLNKKKIGGLILDLRFNPGGLLSCAIEVSNLFVSKGRIVSTSGRNVPERFWDAHKEGALEGFPMVVLVNRYSASASEIVSACLQDHKRAVVVGERTWGKGSVQNVIPLEDHWQDAPAHEGNLPENHSALKLTTASYHRPSGKNIDRARGAKETDEWGVKPDPGFEVKLPDPEIYALSAELQARDLLLPKGLAADDPPKRGEKGKAAGKPEAKPFVDRQLEKALHYLNGELARAN